MRSLNRFHAAGLLMSSPETMCVQTRASTAGWPGPYLIHRATHFALPRETETQHTKRGHLLAPPPQGWTMPSHAKRSQIKQNTRPPRLTLTQHASP